MRRHIDLPIWLICFVVGVVCFLICVGGAIWLLGGVYGSLFSMDIARNVAEYPSVRQHYGGPAGHFPARIPANATSCSMIAHPGALQGSSLFELRFTLPPAEAQALLASMPASAAIDRVTCDYAGDSTIQLLQESGLYKRATLSIISDRYRVFVLSCQGSWNHPRFGGVAIDPIAGDVIYFSEGG